MTETKRILSRMPEDLYDKVLSDSKNYTSLSETVTQALYEKYDPLNYSRLKSPKGNRYSKGPDSFTARELSIVTGSLLGDGGVYFGPRSQNAYYQEGHGTKQAAYLKWKEEELSRFSPSSWTGVHYTSFGDFPYASVYLQACEAFTYLHNKWYLDGKKVVPSDLRLDPIMVAVWYMDDGGGAKIHTSGFDPKENIHLAALLSEFLLCEVNVRTDTRGYEFLYLTKRGQQILAKKCKPYWHETMLYKIEDKI